MNEMRPARDASREQAQFLRVLSRDEAMARFRQALDPKPVGTDDVTLADTLGRVVADHIPAPVDVPPFDRSNVDGFALRARDVVGAFDNSPISLVLNDETIACGTEPRLTVNARTATPIATGGPIPRGADAVVMIEQTDIEDDRLVVRRAVGPAQNVSFAGSDMALGEVVLRKGTQIGSREIAMLAACGIDRINVFRKPRVGVFSTGDELIPPGSKLTPAAIYDSNGPIVAASVAENGGEAISYGIIRDDADRIEATLRKALAECDMVVLSGGTSKGAGDLTADIVGRLGKPGIVAHGVALKPGKPLCLAVVDGKAIVVLPGFPTSAMFTFHEFLVPVLRRMSGLPARDESIVEAETAVAIASDFGRTEFAMVALSEHESGLKAFPLAKGSGAVTSFAQADGFLTIEALADRLPEGTRAPVTLLSRDIHPPDLTIMGSHCPGLEPVLSALSESGIRSRIVAIGSLGGLHAARRGECDIAPSHLFDAKSGTYNASFLDDMLTLVEGWRRMQGIVFRKGDPRFDNRTTDEAIAAALADPDCHMVNRNQGSGTRMLVDGLLKRAEPAGYWNQPRSHNAVAAAVAQGRADWGVAISYVADAYGLGFMPLTEEHFDFIIPKARRERAPIVAFLQACKSAEVQSALTKMSFAPAPKAD
ncbi:MAG: molybdopterin molybdotransferase [Methylobacteriaceae bacterium]|jgi:putative molybdopterin biosynthesis protein|nr:molybdopterin molybdotransferase [Methylobacteriaceae bacterium]